MWRSRLLNLAAALIATIGLPVWAQDAAGTNADDSAQAPAPSVDQAPVATPTPAPVPGPAVEEVGPGGANAPAEEVVAGPATTRGKTKFGEEITVTGSRIRRKDLTTAAPVTVITREQVQASGKVTLGDFLQSMPEQGNAINTSVNNGGDGSSHISLRGLSDLRTLVLVNGRRMVGNAFSSMVSDPSPDLNSIPTSAIERVEVLKDGASAVYGSDAIAGGATVITRRKFDGAEASALAGTSTHGDGNTYDVSVTMGTSGDSGNAMFSAGYFKQDPVFANQRSWSAQPLRYSFAPNGSGGIVGEQAYGSSITPNGHFYLPTNADGSPLAGGNATYNSGFAAGGELTFDPSTGQYRAFHSGLGAGKDSYNFQPYNYLTTPAQRFTLYSAGDHKLGDVARAYYETSFVSRHSATYQAPEPFILSTEELAISKDNIYNPFGVTFDPVHDGTTDFFRRMVEVGPRKSDIQLDTYRLVLGLDGTLPDAAGPLSGFFWDTSLVYGRSNLSEVVIGNMNRNRLAKALGPSYIDPVTGQPRCGTGPGDSDPTCVPLNLFGGAGSITSDQVNYIRTQLANNSFNEQIQWLVNFSGELFHLYADRPVGIAVGYEFRRNRGQYVPDALVSSGEVTGNKSAGTEGGYYTNEGYAELSIPIVNHVPYAETLELTAAARVFDYSSFGSDWTYKIGARYSPIPDVTLRGTYSTAFRAPSLIELYQGRADSYVYVTDPCALATLQGATPPSSCTGAAANNGQDPNSQIRTQQGGNPNLQPETAKIFTAGIVLEPRWVKNLTLTFDYYNIDLEQAIANYGQQYIVDQCYKQGNNQFCNLITRGVNGQITNVVDVYQNVGFTKTDGIDVALRYAVPTPVGRFGFTWDGTWLHKYDIGQPDGTVIHAKGNFDGAVQGSYGVYPALKFNTAVTYALADFGAGVSMRYIGGFKECPGSDTGLLNGNGSYCYVQDSPYRDVSAYATFDMFLSYSLKSSLGRTAVGAGVQNIFDATPSRIYGGFTAASDPSAYDFMGRYFYVRVTQSI